MNQKKLFKITQKEIDVAKEEYFKNGGTITLLSTRIPFREMEVETQKRLLSRRWFFGNDAT